MQIDTILMSVDRLELKLELRIRGIGVIIYANNNKLEHTSFCSNHMHVLKIVFDVVIRFS